MDYIEINGDDVTFRTDADVAVDRVDWSLAGEAFGCRASVGTSAFEAYVSALEVFDAATPIVKAMTALGIDRADRVDGGTWSLCLADGFAYLSPDGGPVVADEGPVIAPDALAALGDAGFTRTACDYWGRPRYAGHGIRVVMD